jgi:hypothetical protein
MLTLLKIHVAENGKRNNVERLFKGEAYRPYRLRYITFAKNITIKQPTNSTQYFS